MTFNIQFFAAAAAHTLQIARAWALKKRAERAVPARHHDPVSTPSRGPLLSMVINVR